MQQRWPDQGSPRLADDLVAGHAESARCRQYRWRFRLRPGAWWRHGARRPVALAAHAGCTAGGRMPCAGRSWCAGAETLPDVSAPADRPRRAAAPRSAAGPGVICPEAQRAGGAAAGQPGQQFAYAEAARVAETPRRHRHVPAGAGARTTCVPCWTAFRASRRQDRHHDAAASEMMSPDPRSRPACLRRRPAGRRPAAAQPSKHIWPSGRRPAARVAEWRRQPDALHGALDGVLNEPVPLAALPEPPRDGLRPGHGSMARGWRPGWTPPARRLFR
ncbi:hypothetical protein ACTMU2_34585 [Cupriavidus basilensis]